MARKQPHRGPRPTPAKKPVAPSVPENEEEGEFDEDVDAVGDLEDGAGDDDDFVESLEANEEDVGPEVAVAGTPWGQAALDAARRVLAGQDDLQLFSLRAIPGRKRVDVRLDKLSGERLFSLNTFSTFFSGPFPSFVFLFLRLMLPSRTALLLCCSFAFVSASLMIRPTFANF
jgi:hypothetical protein